MWLLAVWLHCKDVMFLFSGIAKFVTEIFNRINLAILDSYI